MDMLTSKTSSQQEKATTSTAKDSSVPSSSSLQMLGNLYHYRLTETDRDFINNICLAYKTAIELLKAKGMPNSPRDLHTTVNVTELGVRRIIYFLKFLPDFVTLNQEVMLNLVKSSMMTMLQIHGIISYNKEDNTFKEPNTDDTPFSAEALRVVYGNDIYERVIKIVRTLSDILRPNTCFVQLFMLIMLLDPASEHFASLSDVDRRRIAELQNKYCHLLYGHLLDVYEDEQLARRHYTTMVMQLSDIEQLSRDFSRYVVQYAQPERLRPLMRQLFNWP